MIVGNISSNIHMSKDIQISNPRFGVVNKNIYFIYYSSSGSKMVSLI